MSQMLQYGREAQVEFDLSPESLLADCSQVNGTPISDVAGAAAAALTSPIDFPPLNRAIVPGDVVALALEDDLPRVPELVAGIVAQLIAAGVAPENILVAQTKRAVERCEVDPRSALPEEIREQVGRITHDPAERDEIAFLAADRKGEAVYLSRALCDADMVIPVGCIRSGHWSPNSGAFTGMYPAFSDTEAVLKCRLLMRAAESERKISVKTLSDEAGWLLGSLLTVQVIPGGGNEILQILAGEVQAVMKQGTMLYEQAWQQTIEGEADLVIAAISGDASQQTWENVARAIAAARQVASLSGSIALCTEITSLPDRGVRGLSEVSDPAEARELLSQTDLADAPVAEEIALALEQGSLFFLSGLTEDFVESLGMVPLSKPDQLHRLTQRFQSCVLLGHAQYALLQASEPE